MGERWLGIRIGALIIACSMPAHAQRLPLGPGDPGMSGSPSERLGEALLAVGDLDGDGQSDFVATLPLADTSAGADTGLLRLLSAGPNGGVLRELPGEHAGDRFGSSLTGAPDLDGDGKDEVVIGAPGFQAGMGAIYLYLTSSDTTQILYVGAAGESIGLTLELVTDMDGDGIPDIAAKGISGTVGQVRFISLVTGNPLRSIQSPTSDGSFGNALELVGDLDGLGADDLAIGAPGDDSGAVNGGAMYIVSSETGRFIHSRCDGMAPVNRKAAFTSDSQGASVGFSIARLPDLDLDGRSEIAIGAPGEDRVYIMSSRGRCIIREIDAHSPGSFGSALLSGFDFNSDGEQDLAVAAPSLSYGGLAGVGGVTVYSTEDWKIVTYLQGGESGEHFGDVLTLGPDFGNDTESDILVGCPAARAESGLVYLASYLGVDRPRFADVLHGSRGELIRARFYFDKDQIGSSYVVLLGFAPAVHYMDDGLRLDLDVDVPLSTFVSLQGSYGNETGGGIYFDGGNGLVEADADSQRGFAELRFRLPSGSSNRTLYLQALSLSEEGFVLSSGGPIVCFIGGALRPELGELNVSMAGPQTQVRLWDVGSSRLRLLTEIPSGYSVNVTSDDLRIAIDGSGFVSVGESAESFFEFQLKIDVIYPSGSMESWIVFASAQDLARDFVDRVALWRDSIIASGNFGAHAQHSTCAAFDRGWFHLRSSVSSSLGDEKNLAMAINLPSRDFAGYRTCSKVQVSQGGRTFRAGFPFDCGREVVHHQLEVKFDRGADGRVLTPQGYGVWAGCGGQGNTTCVAGQFQGLAVHRVPVLRIPGFGDCE